VVGKEGCVNSGPDGLGSVLITETTACHLGHWTGLFVDEYCVLKYESLDCNDLIERKENESGDWSIKDNGAISMNNKYYHAG